MDGPSSRVLDAEPPDEHTSSRPADRFASRRGPPVWPHGPAAWHHTWLCRPVSNKPLVRRLSRLVIPNRPRRHGRKSHGGAWPKTVRGGFSSPVDRSHREVGGFGVVLIRCFGFSCFFFWLLCLLFFFLFFFGLLSVVGVFCSFCFFSFFLLFGLFFLPLPVLPTAAAWSPDVALPACVPTGPGRAVFTLVDPNDAAMAARARPVLHKTCPAGRVASRGNRAQRAVLVDLSRRPLTPTAPMPLVALETATAAEEEREKDRSSHARRRPPHLLVPVALRVRVAPGGRILLALRIQPRLGRGTVHRLCATISPWCCDEHETVLWRPETTKSPRARCVSPAQGTISTNCSRPHTVPSNA